MVNVDAFCTKHSVDKDELLELFNECMIHIAAGILNLPSTSKPSSVVKSVVKKTGAKKTTTVKDDRPKCIGQTKTGKDCRNRSLENEQYCKTHLPKEKEEIVEPSPDEAECNAICANGEKCKQKGRMIVPEGAEFKYCFKHSKHWKKHEGASGAEAVEAKEVESDTDSIVLDDDQIAEMKANGLDKKDYLEASDDYDIKESMAKAGIDEKNLTDAKKEKKMAEWKDSNQIVVKATEEGAKVEEKIKPVEEVRTKKTKKPTAWVKSLKDKELKRMEAMEARNREIMKDEDNDEN